MTLQAWGQWGALVGGLCAWGCNGGGTQPPGPPADVSPSGGDAQSWYFNNPLPTPLSVTVLDVSGRAVPGVAVTWTVSSGGGAVSPAQSTTDASGVASTSDSVGSSTIQRVSATVSGVAGPASFTELATTPPTTADVAVADFSFTPKDVVIQTAGTVTWTWGGAVGHNVTYDGGPTPLPANSTTQTTGTHQNTITAVGRYTYHCSVHPTQMTGSVTVVH
jgi:plastocyanin